MIDVLKVNTAELEVGMYVSSLDRPWLDSPFSLQGFRIDSEGDVERLQQYCRYVYVDSQRSAQEKAQLARKLAYRPRTSAGRIFLDRKLKVYEDSSDWSREYPQAEVALEALTEGIDRVFDNVSTGSALDVVKIKMLYEWKGIDFQAELVEAFIQAVGIYPAGSLVELSSGEVAVVVAGYRARRLRPRVMVLLDKDKQPISEGLMIDLLTQKSTSDGRPLEIVSSLEPEAYGIDMTAIQL